MGERGGGQRERAGQLVDGGDPQARAVFRRDNGTAADAGLFGQLALGQQAIEAPSLQERQGDPPNILVFSHVLAPFSVYRRRFARKYIIRWPIAGHKLYISYASMVYFLRGRRRRRRDGLQQPRMCLGAGDGYAKRAAGRGDETTGRVVSSATRSPLCGLWRAEARPRLWLEYRRGGSASPPSAVYLLPPGHARARQVPCCLCARSTHEGCFSIKGYRLEGGRRFPSAVTLVSRRSLRCRQSSNDRSFGGAVIGHFQRAR